MDHTQVRKIYFYLAATIVTCAATIHSMELQTVSTTSKTVHVKQLLTHHPRNDTVLQFGTIHTSYELKTSLEVTQAELAVQEQHVAHKKFDRFYSRYKRVIIPTLITTYSVANLVLSVLSYNGIPQPISSIDHASFVLNVVGSVLGGIGYGGYETIKHIRDGWLDIHQIERIDRLKKQLLLQQLLYDAAAKNDTCTQSIYTDN